MANIKQFKIGASGEAQNFQDSVSDSSLYMYVNASGNLEVSSNPAKPEEPVTPAASCKLNLVSKSELQVKPGQDGAADKAATIQFDCEASAEATEIPFKVCNGALPKASRVVDTKWNTAKWVFDTQKSNLEDRTDFIMQWRLDKWNSGQPSDTQGPIAVKFKAKSFDLRCHGNNPGGGIALQPSGADGSGRENKIKFESSRTSAIDAEGTWGAEGGKGLEFGTFNNEKSSLYTKYYRFRANGQLYAACRETPSMTAGSDKFDYPTQSDDFKDVIAVEYVNWADVINAVRYIKSGSNEPYATWLAANKLHVASNGIDGFDESNMQYNTSE